MGAGYHGGFGNTLGSDRAYKMGYSKSGFKFYTREEIINSLKNITRISHKIAELVETGEIGLNVIGDRLMKEAFNYGPEVVGFYSNGQIYLRYSSKSLLSDLVHEGQHAIDHKIKGKNMDYVKSRVGEFRAYSAEREYQINRGEKELTFKSLIDLWEHIKKYYK